ncbi:MAG: signal peptidase II [Deltaproteobacteria bacterium]|nr:signal peptidase II [Deltaproteobacteria bacterium]MBW2067738.1 signal peptidase II [Deltaproteobacteria bacterium]
MSKAQKFACFWLVGLGVLLCDQCTKYLVIHHVRPGDSLSVVEGFFRIVNIRNAGGAFNIFSDGGSSDAKRIFFAIIAMAAVVVLHVVVKRMKKPGLWHVVPFGLILGGALGNLVDRLRLGAVVDFLDFYVGSYHWPAFNCADAAITVGAAAILLREFSGG